MSGYDDEDAFDEFIAGFDLRKHVGGMTAPYLVIAGEDDQLSPVEHTEELFTHISAPKQLVVFEGANHAVGDAPSVALGPNRNTLLGEWFLDRFAGRPMESERVTIDATGREHPEPF